MLDVLEYLPIRTVLLPDRGGTVRAVCEEESLTIAAKDFLALFDWT